MRTESQFLRKIPLDNITEPEEKLFKDKLTPNTEFLNHLMFGNGREILSWKDEEKAIQELNALKDEKKKLDAKYAEMVNYLIEVTSPAANKTTAAIAALNLKIQNYVREHSGDIKLDKVDGVERGEMVLGDYKVEIVKTVKIKKASLVKPGKEDTSDNEVIFSESVIEEPGSYKE